MGWSLTLLLSGYPVANFLSLYFPDIRHYWNLFRDILADIPGDQRERAVYPPGGYRLFMVAGRNGACRSIRYSAAYLGAQPYLRHFNAVYL